MSIKTIPCSLSLLLAATLPVLAGAGDTNSIGIHLAPIPAGSFPMGQAEREKSFKNPWSAR